MADPLWMEVRQFAQKMAWPTAKVAAPESRVVYEAGLDIVNSYSGDPAVLVKALRQFAQCQSAAYANAGIPTTKMACGKQNGSCSKHKRRFPIELRSTF